jgi:hypothetical protein
MPETVKSASVPPVWAVNAALRLRRLLLRMADSVVPAKLPAIDRFLGVANTAALHAAARLRIPEMLEEAPLTSAQIAERTGTRADLVERMLRMLVAINVFRRLPDGRYANNRVSKALISGSPDNLRGFALWFGMEPMAHSWSRLHTVLHDGEVAFEKVNELGLWHWLGSDPEAHDAFTEGMRAATESDAPSVTAAFPFGEASRVCDVGGGMGAQLASILAKHPDVRGVLYDDAATLAKAEAFLGELGLADRIEFVPGSFMDHVPRGADVYFIRLVLHNWDDDRALRILRNCRAAMDSGQRLVVVEFVYGPDPLITLVPYMDMVGLTLFGARERTPDEIAELLERSGFRHNRMVHLPAGLGLYVGVAE